MLYHVRKVAVNTNCSVFARLPRDVALPERDWTPHRVLVRVADVRVRPGRKGGLQLTSGRSKIDDSLRHSADRFKKKKDYLN